MELTQFNLADPTPVAAIAFNDAITSVLTVHLSGNLRRVELLGGRLLASFPVTAISVGGVAFDRGAHSLAVVSGDTPLKHFSGLASDLKGMRVWDTDSGHVRSEDTADWRTLYAGVAFHPSGIWLVATLDGLATMYESTTGHISDVRSFYNLHEGPAAGCDTVVFDEPGEYIAVACRDGIVGIARVVSGTFQTSEQIATRAWDTRHSVDWYPTAIAFSPSRRWLALVASGKLLILDLQAYWHITRGLELSSGLEYMFTEVGLDTDRGSALAFDPSGDMLAVGTGKGWQVWDVPSKQKLAGAEVSPVYALTFSPDGHLLAYGDAHGIVHVLGVSGR